MPKLSVRFIRASLLYLLVGFSIGALILAEKGISFYPAIWRLFPIHMEFLLAGWLIQLAMGVGFWIFPRFGYDAPRGNEQLAEAAFWSFNAGILLTVFQPWIYFALTAGRILEAAGIVLYVLGSWRRIKPHGSPTPKAS